MRDHDQCDSYASNCVWIKGTNSNPKQNTIETNKSYLYSGWQKLRGSTGGICHLWKEEYHCGVSKAKMMYEYHFPVYKRCQKLVAGVLTTDTDVAKAQEVFWQLPEAGTCSWYSEEIFEWETRLTSYILEVRVLLRSDILHQSHALQVRGTEKDGTEEKKQKINADQTSKTNLTI